MSSIDQLTAMLEQLMNKFVSRPDPETRQEIDNIIMKIKKASSLSEQRPVSPPIINGGATLGSKYKKRFGEE